jgi:carboxylesterase
MHGFTASPHDMRLLGAHLHARGHSVNAVRLAGHGSSPEDLQDCHWREWYASAHQGLETLGQRTAGVVAVGQSMGALLALKLAVDHPSTVRGLALLSPALRLSNRWLERLAPLLPVIAPLLGYHHKGDSDIADAEARRQNPTYRRVPLRAVHQFLLLQKHVRPLLPRVAQPTLVIHSRQDHACGLDNVALLENSVRGHQRSVILDDSYHVISVDVERDRVAAEVAAFVEKVLDRPTTQSGAGGDLCAQSRFGSVPAGGAARRG